MAKMVPGSKTNYILPSSRQRAGKAESFMTPLSIVLPEGGAPVVKPANKVFGCATVGEGFIVAASASAVFHVPGYGAIRRFDLTNPDTAPIDWSTTEDKDTILGASEWYAARGAAATSDKLYIWGPATVGGVYGIPQLMSRDISLPPGNDWVKLSPSIANLYSLIRAGAGLTAVVLPDISGAPMWYHIAVDSVSGIVYLKIAVVTASNVVRWFLLRMTAPNTWAYVSETDCSDLQFALSTKSVLITFNPGQTTMTLHGSPDITVPLPVLPATAAEDTSVYTTGIRNRLWATMLGTSHYALLNKQKHARASQSSMGGLLRYDMWEDAGTRDGWDTWVYRDGAWATQGWLATHLFNYTIHTRGKLAGGQWAIVYGEDTSTFDSSFDGEAVRVAVTRGDLRDGADPLQIQERAYYAKIGTEQINGFGPGFEFTYGDFTSYQTSWEPFTTHDGYTIFSVWTHLGS